MYTKTSRGVDERLCSESGARLDSQAGDKKCIERVNYERKYSEAYLETRGRN